MKLITFFGKIMITTLPMLFAQPAISQSLENRIAALEATVSAQQAIIDKLLSRIRIYAADNTDNHLVGFGKFGSGEDGLTRIVISAASPQKVNQPSIRWINPERDDCDYSWGYYNYGASLFTECAMTEIWGQNPDYTSLSIVPAPDTRSAIEVRDHADISALVFETYPDTSLIRVVGREDPVVEIQNANFRFHESIFFGPDKQRLIRYDPITDDLVIAGNYPASVKVIGNLSDILPGP